jgi:L1 cell adhesion molecule like protein
MAEPIIGIDLGTTYSCVACFDPKTQKVEVIESPSGRTMPSWVSFTPEGKLVGTAAKSQVASNPRNTVYDVKRIIGRSFSDPVTAEEAKAFPFRIVEGGAHGEPRIVVDWRGETKELRPEEISAMILAGEVLRCACPVPSPFVFGFWFRPLSRGFHTRWGVSHVYNLRRIVFV